MSFDPIFLHESSSWVELRLHIENLNPGYPGSVRILVRVILDQAMLEAMLCCFRKLKSIPSL